MSRAHPTLALSVGQLSVARRNAMARGWSARQERSATPCEPSSVQPARVPRRIAIPRDTDPDSVRTFTYQVAMATQGPVLRYSQRLRLLALANEAGIARFDANLIIAAIENHRERPRGMGPQVLQPIAKRGALPTMLAALCVQATLIALTWAALMR